MTVNANTAVGYTAADAKTTSKTESSIMGKDDFLKLLVTQLRYQNPLEPMEDKEFIAQMATFSSLEQMQNLNQTMTAVADTINNQWLPAMMLQQAGQMVGREVAYLSADEDGELQTRVGVVDAVVVRQGTPYLVVGDEAITLDSVTEMGGSVISMESAYLSKMLEKLDQILTALGTDGENSDG